MLRHKPKQYSFHSELDKKIPEKHILKKVARAVDFSFINSLLEDTYWEHQDGSADLLKKSNWSVGMCSCAFLHYIEFLVGNTIHPLSYMSFLTLRGLKLVK